MKTYSKSISSFGKYAEIFLIIFFLAFSVLVVLQQANPALNKLGRDAGAFAYIGSHIIRGHAPYIAAWDSKPPGVFLINALGLWLGRGTRWGIWFVEFLSLFGATLAGFLGLQKRFGSGIALISSAIWLYGLNSILIGGNFTEEYSLLYGFLALFLFSISLENKKSLWLYMGIGISIGCSFLFRPNNIGVQVSIVLTIIILEVFEKQYLDLIKKLIAIGLSALLPISAMTVYLLSKGALQDFWNASFIYNFSYTGGGFNLAGAFASGLSRLGFPVGFALIGFMMAVLAIGARLKNKEPLDPIFLWIILNGVVENMLSALSGRNYEHYFINWLPLIAFASALSIYQALPSFTTWVNKHSTTFSLIALLVFGLFFIKVPGEFWQSAQPILFHRSANIQFTDLVAEYVNIHTNSDQTVLVWGGQAGINFLAQRDSPTPYLFYPLYVPSKSTDEMSEDFYNTIVSNPPALIVDGSTYDPNQLIPLSTISPLLWLKEHRIYNTPYLIEVLRFVRENYTLVDTVVDTDIYHFK
jgi:hypothetical protein